MRRGGGQPCCATVLCTCAVYLCCVLVLCTCAVAGPWDRLLPSYGCSYMHHPSGNDRRNSTGGADISRTAPAPGMHAWYTLHDSHTNPVTEYSSWSDHTDTLPYLRIISLM